MDMRFRTRTVGIELVRGCNFACRMCPVTADRRPGGSRPRFMSLDLVRRIADELEANPSVQTIWLFNFGEPLLHPGFEEILTLLHNSAVARNAFVILHTNASRLAGGKAEALLSVPLVKKLVFSFDGHDRASYEALRGPHYDAVLENIARFAAAARQRRPGLILATCTILPRPGEVPALPSIEADRAIAELKAVFDPLGVQVETRTMHDYSGNERLEVAGRRKAEVFGGCALVEDDALYITVDGRAQPCCAVYDPEFNVGVVGLRGLDELINGPELARIRHLLRLDRRHELDFCRNCALSLGGYLTAEQLRAFWDERRRQDLLTDVDEAAHLAAIVAGNGKQTALQTAPAVRPATHLVQSSPPPG